MRLSPQTGCFLGVDPGPPRACPPWLCSLVPGPGPAQGFPARPLLPCSAAVKGQVSGFPISERWAGTWGASSALMVGPVLVPGPWALSIQAVLAREAVSGCRWLWAAPSNPTHAKPSLVPSEAHILPASKGSAELQLGKPGPIRVNPAPSWPSPRPRSPLSGSAKGQAGPHSSVCSPSLSISFLLFHLEPWSPPAY